METNEQLQPSNYRRRPGQEEAAPVSSLPEASAPGRRGGAGGRHCRLVWRTSNASSYEISREFPEPIPPPPRANPTAAPLTPCASPPPRHSTQQTPRIKRPQKPPTTRSQYYGAAAQGGRVRVSLMAQNSLLKITVNSLVFFEKNTSDSRRSAAARTQNQTEFAGVPRDKTSDSRRSWRGLLY